MFSRVSCAVGRVSVAAGVKVLIEVPVGGGSIAGMGLLMAMCVTPMLAQRASIRSWRGWPRGARWRRSCHSGEANVEGPRRRRGG